MSIAQEHDSGLQDGGTAVEMETNGWNYQIHFGKRQQHPLLNWT